MRYWAAESVYRVDDRGEVDVVVWKWMAVFRDVLERAPGGSRDERDGRRDELQRA